MHRTRLTLTMMACCAVVTASCRTAPGTGSTRQAGSAEHVIAGERRPQPAASAAVRAPMAGSQPTCFRSSDPSQRVAALEKALSLDAKELKAELPEVAALLTDETPYERETRTANLGDDPKGGSYHPSRAIVVQEPIGNLAATVLVKAGEPAVTALASALASPLPTVRRRATCALARIGHAGAVQPLAEMVRDQDETTKTCAVEALGHASGAWPLEPLCALIGAEPDVVLRRRAIHSLATIRQVPREQDGRAACLIPLLRDAQPGVVGNAVSALGWLRVESAVPDIIGILRQGKHWQRALAAKALGSIGDRRAIAALRKATVDSDSDVRHEAKQALQQIHSGHRDAGIEPFDLVPDF